MPLIAVVLLVLFVASVAGFAGYSVGHTKGSLQSNLTSTDRKVLVDAMRSSARELEKEAKALRVSGFVSSADSTQASSERLHEMAQRVSRGEIEAL